MAMRLSLTNVHWPTAGRRQRRRPRAPWVQWRRDAAHRSSPVASFEAPERTVCPVYSYGPVDVLAGGTTKRSAWAEILKCLAARCAGAGCMRGGNCQDLVTRLRYRRAGLHRYASSAFEGARPGSGRNCHECRSGRWVAAGAQLPFSISAMHLYLEDAGCSRSASVARTRSR